MQVFRVANTNNVGFKDASLDSFSRLRTSSPFTILDLKQVGDSYSLFYDNQETSGSGTSSTYNSNQSSTTLSVSASTAGVRVQQSKLRGLYQPGKGLLALVTGLFGAHANGITKRIGYFDDKNGLFFQTKDGVLSVVKRTYTSGSPDDIAVDQADWNLDKMDGTGPSKIVLDVSKVQIYVIDFEWLGVGRVRFAVNIDGKFYYVHEMVHANISTTVYMSNPNLPIRYEIENDGTGGASSLTSICASIINEGNLDDAARSIYLSRRGVAQTLANQDLYTPIISFRMKSGSDYVRVVPAEVNILSTSSTNFEWRLLLNPTISGVDAASWTGATGSSLEYDVSRTTDNLVASGYSLAGGYGSSTNQGRTPVSNNVKSFLTIGTNIDGSSDELVLAIANLDANGGTIYGGVTFGEYY